MPGTDERSGSRAPRALEIWRGSQSIPPVQPENVTLPTDAKLRHAACKGLNRATKPGVNLRQSYLRLAKRAAMMAVRYAHAKHFKRHHREVRFLRRWPGRLLRVLAWPRDFLRQIFNKLSVDFMLQSAFNPVSKRTTTYYC